MEVSSADMPFGVTVPLYQVRAQGAWATKPDPTPWLVSGTGKKQLQNAMIGDELVILLPALASYEIEITSQVIFKPTFSVEVGNDPVTATPEA